MSKNTTKIDHLVIGAKDLAQGMAFVKDILGVEMPFGGVHTAMGTHNHLMRLGDELFLEVIAVNPHMKSSGRPRWFGLDDPFVRRRIEEKPILLTWVVNTIDIKRLLKLLSSGFGTPQKVSRGDLTWHFGLPEDGSLLAGGMLPYVMQWQTDVHPAARMADLGCRFQHLEIYHPHAQWLSRTLGSIGADTLVCVHELPGHDLPYLEAHIETPHGVKVIRSHGF